MTCAYDSVPCMDREAVESTEDTAVIKDPTKTLQKKSGAHYELVRCLRTFLCFEYYTYANGKGPGS